MAGSELGTMRLIPQPGKRDLPAVLLGAGKQRKWHWSNSTACTPVCQEKSSSASKFPVFPQLPKDQKAELDWGAWTNEPFLKTPGESRCECELFPPHSLVFFQEDIWWMNREGGVKGERIVFSTHTAPETQAGENTNSSYLVSHCNMLPTTCSCSCRETLC